MKELFGNFTFSELLLFIFLVLAGIKEGWSLVEFFIIKVQKKFGKEKAKDKKETDLLNQLSDFNTQIQSLIEQEKQLSKNLSDLKKDNEDHFKDIDSKLDLLTQSDKDSIKSWIVEKHHFFIEQGWVDDFNMDAIEKRFTHYQKEGGNSYVHDLMTDLRKLPNRRT